MRIKPAAGLQLGPLSSIASHGRWVTGWVGRASHNARNTAKLLMHKQKIPGSERYDIVCILDGPDEQSISAFTLAIAGQGNVRGQTLRAFSKDEMGVILGKLP